MQANLLHHQRGGLTEWTSSRVLQANRSALAGTALDSMRHVVGSGQFMDRSAALQDRLEELLVFEILQDG